MGEKYLWADPRSYKNLTNPNNKYLHWVTDTKDELPIIMGPTPDALMPPRTFVQLFEKALSTNSNSLAFRYKANNEWIT